MKVTKGRGIQFFKHPVFMVPQKFVVNTYNKSKSNFKNLVGGIVALPNKITKKGKK